MTIRPLALALTLVCASGAALADDWSITPVSPLHKLVETAPGVLEPYDGMEPVISSAEEGHGDLQLVVQAGNLPIEVTQVRILSEECRVGGMMRMAYPAWYWEDYVSIPHPSGNRRLETGWWPDALIPLDLQPKRSIPAHHAEVLWLDVEPGSACGLGMEVATSLGLKKIEIDVQGKGPFRLPHTLRANAAIYYDTVRDWYTKNGVKSFTDAEWEEEKRKYYEFLLDFDLNAYDLPVAWGTPEAAKYLRDPRVLSVRVPPVQNSDFPLAVSQLQATGTMAKAYAYTIDEPSPGDYGAVRAAEKVLRPLGIKQCVTVAPVAELANQVDIWCPNIGDWFGVGHLDAAALAQERARGHETWWYTMVQPRYPYPTWLVDDDGTSVYRYGGLMNSWGITGFVYSMVHGWGPHPLSDISSFAGTNGDGTLVYPAELVGGSGPMPSIRLMLLREAIENYEILHQQSPVPPVSPLPLFTPDPKTPATISFSAQRPLRETLRRFDEPAPEADTTVATLQTQGLFLRVTVHGELEQGVECWVEVAPSDLRAQPERLRFGLDGRGHPQVTRRTRNGASYVLVPGYSARQLATPYGQEVVFAIPWQELGYGNTIRLNVRRRTTDRATGTPITLSAWPDGNDPSLMPLWRTDTLSRHRSPL